MDSHSENPQVSEYQAQGRATAQEERAAFENPNDDQILKWCESGESGDAEFFIHRFRGRLCFPHAAGLWCQFPPGGHHWRDCELQEPLAMVGTLIEAYEKLAGQMFWRRTAAVKNGDEKAAKAAEATEMMILKKIASMRRRRYRQDVLILAAAGVDSLGITGAEWDQQPLLLPFRNGILEQDTDVFRPGRSKDYIKTFAPTDWLGLEHPAPRFEAFISEIMAGDAAMVQYLQRLFGSALPGRITEHILPVLVGAGRNGKSVLIESIGHVLGPLAGPIQGEMLLAQKFSRNSAAPSPDVMALRGRRIVWATETDEGRRLNSGKVKLLTGGDSLTARGPFDRKEVVFTPSHSIFLITNFKPKANPRDKALWARLHIINFPVSFVDDPAKANERLRNPQLLEDLKKEASGIAAWLVRGYHSWREKGLAPPPQVLDQTEGYRKEEDSVSQFIEEICVVAEGAIGRADELHQGYSDFCEETGLKALGKKTFFATLHQDFEKGRDKKGSYYKGLGIKEIL